MTYKNCILTFYKEEKKLLFDQIEWGLLNHFDVDENMKSGNKEFNKLKSRIDFERKKANL